MWKWIAVTTSAGAAYLFFKPKKEPEIVLRKPDFKENIVYMVQFPASPYIRTISPFALKLETWLRLKNVPYEPVYSQKFSRKGQIPYIELNGQQYPDSNQIVQELQKMGIAPPDENMTPDKKAISHLATVAIENHTCICGFHWRYGFHMEEFYHKLIAPCFRQVWSLQVFRILQSPGMLFRTKLHGIGRHSLDEVAEFSFQDLDALSVLLGDKPFFNGDTPSTVDCTVFGHLAQFLYLPMDIQ